MTMVEENGHPPTDGLVNVWQDDGVGTFGFVADGGGWQWSAATAMMYGQDPSAVPCAASFLQCIHAEDRDTLKAALSRIAKCQPVRAHHRVIEASGPVRWLEMASHPVRNAAGTVTGSSGLVIDVTAAVESGTTVALAAMAPARARIEQVKGVLMAVYGLSADQAFDALTTHSQQTNVKLRNIAARFLDIVPGYLPGAIRPQVERALVAAACEADNEYD